MSLLFTYGTLQQNQRNHWRLLGSRYLGAAVVRGELYQFPYFNFPILRRRGANWTHGELYEVGRAVIELNDEEEKWYRRVKALAYLTGRDKAGFDIPVSCWVYEGLNMLPLGLARRLTSGRWPDVRT